MEMEMISSEKIKPNSPTPDNLRIYKISLLDQINAPIYSPAILYFAPHPTSKNNADEKIQLLKDSLASTLTTFYPFGGVVKDPLSVDCNDEGLPFYVAKVKGQMRDFLQHPDMQLINRFLPSDFSLHGFAGPGANVAAIQLSCFDCGGIAVSVIFAHNIADITSICTFLRAWASTARGCGEVTPLNCNAQSAFPQMVAMPRDSYMFYPLMKFVSIGKFVTRRYVFDASSISTLKSQLSNDKHPTRVELVSALIWKCFMEVYVAAEKSSTDHKPFWLTHVVNLRKRAEPPIPENSFGNFLWLASAVCTTPMDTDLKDLVNEVKRGISRIDEEFVKRMEGDHRGYYENLKGFIEGIPSGEANWFPFTSWCKIGLYDIDFGWGKPMWLSGSVSGDSVSAMPNNVTLMDTRSGDGIEAWVMLEQKYVAGFDNNEELKMYARFNPSVF